MNYDFDTVTDRRGTACYKYDGMKNACTTSDENSIPMFVADMDFRTAPCIISAFEKLVEHGIFGYTSDRVEPKYASAVCKWWKERYECEFSADSVIYSNGAVEAVKTAIRAFSNEGDGIIIQRPVYGHFTYSIEGECHRRAVDNHMIEKDGYYTVDYEDLEKKCSDRKNKVMILCSPANPVGRVWRTDELEKICEITSRYGVVLVSDEVHCDIIRKGEKHHPILNITDKAIMVTAINKTFNLAGLQCANVIIPDKELREKFNSGWDGASPTPFAVAALIAAYSDDGYDWVKAMNEYIDNNLKYVCDFIKREMPFVKVHMPQGTYCLWLDFSGCGLSPDEIKERIYVKANVILQEGTVHDPNGVYCHRMCVPCSLSVIKTALTRISEQFKV